MIKTVNDEAFVELCQKLAADRNSQLATARENRLPWPSEQLSRMAQAGGVSMVRTGRSRRCGLDRA